MSNFLKKQWREMKDKGENIGVVFVILGVLILFAKFVFVLSGLQTEIDLLNVFLGLSSVGLGFIAIGLSQKADKKLVKLLQGQDIIVQPTGNVTVTPRPAELVVETFAPEVIVEHKSKESSQKRLDEDTKRVGYVRGVLYQLEDGSWGIAWGGKYPL